MVTIGHVERSGKNDVDLRDHDYITRTSALCQIDARPKKKHVYHYFDPHVEYENEARTTHTSTPWPTHYVKKNISPVLPRMDARSGVERG